MRYFNKKPKNNRGIVGITGILLLILGVVSLIFQYSTTVEVYAQVSVGPYLNVPFRSEPQAEPQDPVSDRFSQDSDSDRTDTFLAFQERGAERVYIANFIGRDGLRAQAVDGDAQLIIDGGTKPAIDVTLAGRVFVAAEQQGEIVSVECTDDDDCQAPESVSNPNPDTEPPVGIEGEGSEDSCVDDVDNDGDNRIDIADTDCKWSSQQESSMRGLCSDGLDNDGDRDTDSDDEDCRQQPGGTAGAEEDTAETAGAEEDTAETAGAEEDTAETAGAEDNDTAGVEPTSFNLQPGTTTTSPQLTFVSTDGGDGPPASNADIASSNDGNHVYAVWEQNEEIMLAASHNGGPWGAAVIVSNTPAAASIDPRVATSPNGQIVHVTWQENPDNGEIFYARLTNFGETKEPPISLSNTSGRSEDHELLVEGSNVYVVWVDFTNTGFGGEIFFKRSSETGSFGDTTNLSAGTGQSFLSSRDPDMAAQENKVAVTWTAKPDRNAVRPGEILVRESLDRGNPGTFDKQINAAQTSRTDSKEPQIDYIPESSGEIYVAFLDTGGPRRVSTEPGTYNVLATERDSRERPFSALYNLSDAPNPPNPHPQESDSQLEIVFDVAIWDPSGRRG